MEKQITQCKSCCFFRFDDDDDLGTCTITDNITESEQEACKDFKNKNYGE